MCHVVLQIYLHTSSSLLITRTCGLESAITLKSFSTSAALESTSSVKKTANIVPFIVPANLTGPFKQYRWLLYYCSLNISHLLICCRCLCYYDMMSPVLIDESNYVCIVQQMSIVTSHVVEFPSENWHAYVVDTP